MKWFIKKGLSNNVILATTILNRRIRKFLAVIALVGLLWSYIPFNQIQAEMGLFDTEVEIPLTEDAILEEDINYPTTTDSDFDLSQVEIDNEVINERTLSTKTFRKIDGTYEVAMYNDVIHFEDEGELQNIDNSLSFDENTSEYENKDNIFKLKFPNKLDDNKTIKLSMDKYSIYWNVLNIDEAEIYYEDTDIAPSNIKELININQSLIYEDILPGIDMEYIITGSKIKENIILDNYTSNFSLSFEYKLKDLDMITDEEGNIVFANEDNEVIFSFESLYMFDNELDESSNVTFDYIQTGNKEYSVTITPNDEWLQTASYPVTIDPSITLQQSSTEIRDKYVYGNYSNGTRNYVKSGNIGSYQYRSYVEITLSSLPENASVNYAFMTLNTYSTSNYCDADCQVNVREVNRTTTFDNITNQYLTDVNPRIIDYKLINSSDGANIDYIWDISRNVKAWIFDGYSNGVLEFRNDDESIIDYVFFDSSEYSSVTGPAVSIGYVDTTGLKDYWTYNQQNIGVVGTGYVSDYTGKLTFIRNDYSFTTEKQSLGLSLAYNIDNKDTSIGYGLGWQTNYNMKVLFNSSLGRYYSLDATGNEVYYHTTTCDTRISSDYPVSNICYLAEDGSSNILVRSFEFSTLSNTYILTNNQIKYNFGIDEYLDSIYDIKKTLNTVITRNSSNKDLITVVTDDSGNKIDFVYSSNRLYYTTLSLKQNDNSYSIIEKINYYYTYKSAVSNYALFYTKSYKNYDSSEGLILDYTIYYLSDSYARLTQAYISGRDKVVYTYNTATNKITNVKSYSNNYQFGDVDYTYDFQKTTLTNHNGDYINYYFDNYGHTVNIRDNFGNTKFYNYMNLFKAEITDTTYGGVIDIILTDGTPNYKNNHKLISSSDPMKTQYNPVNNHGFEYSNIYEEVKWNYEDDSGEIREDDRTFTNDISLIGDYSALIRANSTDTGHFEQYLVLDIGSYVLSGYVKNDTDSSTNAYIDIIDESYLVGTIPTVPNDGEWHYVEIQFGISVNNKDVEIHLINHAVGNAYFDNIQIVDGFRDTRKNLMDNPSMEVVDSSGDLPGWIFSNSTYVNRVDHSSQIAGIDSEILGEYSIKIDGSPTQSRYAHAGIGNFIDLSRLNGTLIIGAWAKSEGTPTSQMASTISAIDDINRKFRIRIEIQDYNYNIISKEYIDFDPSIEGWQYVLEQINLPEETDYIIVYFEYQGAGSVYFDGLQIYYENMNTDYDYDAYGHVEKITTPSGDTTEFSYDNIYDSRTTYILMSEGDIELEITDEDELVSEVDFNNVKSTPTYNSKGQVTQLLVGDTSSDYFTTSTTYLSTGFNQYKSTTTNEFNKTTNYYHDTLTGLLEAIENANGEDLQYIYDNEGKLIKAVSLSDYSNPTQDIHGVVEYEYDTQDRLSRIILDSNYYYELSYDLQNRISEINVNSQTLMSYSYEMDVTIFTDRLSTQTYGNGDALKFTYTDEGQISVVEFKNSGDVFHAKFSYEYDQSGNMTTFNTYDDNENIESSEYYTYDSSNRLIQVIDNENNIVKYTYDQSGNVTSLYFNLEEIEGNTNYFYNHCFVYDESAEECTSKSNVYDRTEYTTQSDVDVKKEYYHEDSALYRLDYIKLVTGVDDVLVKQDFSYSGDTTRLYEIIYDISDNSSDDYKYRYSYDDLGNITDVYYYEETTIKTHDHYEYDEMNQLIIEDVYDYDEDCTILENTCYTKMFYYDLRGNITDVKTFLYGDRDEITFPIPDFAFSQSGSTYILMSYNGSNYYDDIYELDIDETPSFTFLYFDPILFQMVTGVNTVQTYSNLDNSTEGYYYSTFRATGSYVDATFRIVFKVGNPVSGTTTPEEHIHYNYDNSWLDQLSGYGTIEYIDDEPQTEVAVQEYVYDNQGNPITITEFYYSGNYYDHADLSYDGRQLKEIIVYSDSAEANEVVTISYTYNDQGYRTSKTIDDGTPQTIEYTLLGDKVIYETDGFYEIVYTYDYDGKIISFSYEDTNTSAKEFFYLRNQQGDITKIIDKDGNVKVEYTYDAWGRIINVEDYSNQEEVLGKNRYFYRGYRYDVELRLYYLNSRFYNPVVGRFINADGLLGAQGNVLGHNMYAYTQNNPVMYSDISGYAPEWLKSIGNWVVEHKTELIIGTAFIVAGILTMGVATAIGGASFATVMSAMGSAAVSSAVNVGISMGVSATIGGTVSQMSGNGFMSGFSDGLASGYMWGGIFAGTAQVLSGAMKTTRYLAPNFNGQYFGKLKLWSPNASGNPNVGGTLMKFGKYNRIDVEAGGLMHLAWRVGGSKINHIPAGTIISSIIGGLN